MPVNSYSEEPARFLAIDYGLKRVGLALSDPLNIFAYSFKTILNDKNLLNELEIIIKEKNVIKIILGYPLDEKEKKSNIAGYVEKFAKELKKKNLVKKLFCGMRSIPQ